MFITNELLLSIASICQQGRSSRVQFIEQNVGNNKIRLVLVPYQDSLKNDTFIALICIDLYRLGVGLGQPVQEPADLRGRLRRKVPQRQLLRAAAARVSDDVIARDSAVPLLITNERLNMI